MGHQPTLCSTEGNSLLVGYCSSSGIDITTWDINLLCVLLKVTICYLDMVQAPALISHVGPQPTLCSIKGYFCYLDMVQALALI